MSDRPDGGVPARQLRIVRGGRAIPRKPHHLAEVVLRVLRLILQGIAIADGQKKGAVVSEYDARAEVLVGRIGRLLAEDHCDVGEAPARVREFEFAAGEAGAVAAAFARFGIGKVDLTRLCEVGRQSYVEQPALARSRHFRDIRDRRRDDALRRHQSQPAGPFRYQQSPARQKLQAPRMCEARRKRFDLDSGARSSRRARLLRERARRQHHG
jgi:hypothetical protein